MIFHNHVSANYKVFRVSFRVILFSSLFMGILASIPKILQLHISMIELVVDSSIAFLFTLSIWYFNLYKLPRFSSQHITTDFFSRRLVFSLLVGIGLMVLLVIANQLLFSRYNFQSMMLMYQFRGVLINLTVYMFLHLLYQGYTSQQISVELERTKADSLGAQYELLKQQVNPHFLFNSLNTLKSMIDTDDEHASDFILKLYDFYRSTLENRKLDVIPLAEELKTLNAYMFLLKARFEDGISLEVNITQEHISSYIPPFTLQLVAENCIKHNVVSLEQPLHIRLYSCGDDVVLENRLQPKKNPELSTQMGLENINQRYIHLVDKSIIVVNDSDVFKVKLPVIYEYNHH